MINMQGMLEQLEDKGWDGTVQKSPSEFSEEDIRAIIREEKVSETHACQVNFYKSYQNNFFLITYFFRFLVVIGGERDVAKWL